MPKLNELFYPKGNADITNLPTLARDPYNLITPANNLNFSGDRDGMWALNTRGIALLNKSLKVPKTVLFSTTGPNYEIVNGIMINWDQAPDLNLQQTLAILNTF